MKKLEKFKNLTREVKDLITKFFKPYGLSDELLQTPKNVKKMGLKLGIINSSMTVVSLIFAFMLKASNLLIEQRLILLGIICFMLYRSERLIDEAFNVYNRSEDEKFSLVIEDSIIYIGSKIMGNVAEKVLKYDKVNNLYKIMSNEAVQNTIKNYLQNLWQKKIHFIFDVFEIISVIIMLICSIVTNTAIPQFIFIPLLIGFGILTFFSSAYISLIRKDYYNKRRECNNEKNVLTNDLLRVPTIVKQDVEMRIEKLQKNIVSNNKNVINFYNKLNISRLIITIVESFCQYGIIILYLLSVKWDEINLATITEITATLVIVQTALNYIRRIASIFNDHNDRLVIIEREQSDMELILSVYHKEGGKISNAKVIKNISIKPFSIRYIEESENDKPFTLTSKDSININSGEIVILYGPSGSGKSTFMKMLTERIRLEKSTEIPSTSRYLFYDERLRFGSSSLYEEIFCGTKNPNLEKMQNILENLHLWQEIECNCVDIWQWMKEKQFQQSLSNGQKQRLILAKMLYWLDDEIDVLVLDECTSGLDDKAESDSADAERILEYIVKYANTDKKRIVIISTHQNIDGFKEKLSDEGYAIRNLIFLKDNESNLVKEI